MAPALSLPQLPERERTILSTAPRGRVRPSPRLPRRSESICLPLSRVWPSLREVLSPRSDSQPAGAHPCVRRRTVHLCALAQANHPRSYHVPIPEIRNPAVKQTRGRTNEQRGQRAGSEISEKDAEGVSGGVNVAERGARARVTSKLSVARPEAEGRSLADPCPNGLATKEAGLRFPAFPCFYCPPDHRLGMRGPADSRR